MNENKKQKVIQSLTIILEQTRCAKVHLTTDKSLRSKLKIKKSTVKQKPALPWENNTIEENLATIEAYTENLIEDLKIEWENNDGKIKE